MNIYSQENPVVYFDQPWPKLDMVFVLYDDGRQYKVLCKIYDPGSMVGSDMSLFLSTRLQTVL